VTVTTTNALLLDKAISTFSSRIAEIEFQRFTSIRYFETQFAATKALNDHLATVGVPENSAVTGSRTFFVDLAQNADVLDMRESGIDSIPIPRCVATRSQLIAHLSDSLDRQLAWLLVDTFEAHERFLKDIYATLGFLNPDAWPAMHYQSAKPVWSRFCRLFTLCCRRQTESHRPHEWFVVKVRSVASRNCDPILKQLRILIPDLGKYEATPWVSDYTDVVVWRAVAEILRHITVHQNRQIKSDEFWKAVQKKSGRSIHGAKESVQRFRARVQEVLTETDGVLTVRLIDRSNVAREQFAHIDKYFKRLFESIINHSFLVYHLVTLHCGEQPYWKRSVQSAASP
jgi:hypothetical protein